MHWFGFNPIHLPNPMVCGCVLGGGGGGGGNSHPGHVVQDFCRQHANTAGFGAWAGRAVCLFLAPQPDQAVATAFLCLSWPHLSSVWLGLSGGRGVCCFSSPARVASHLLLFWPQVAFPGSHLGPVWSLGATVAQACRQPLLRSSVPFEG